MGRPDPRHENLRLRRDRVIGHSGDYNTPPIINVSVRLRTVQRDVEWMRRELEK
ncbi:MAG: hypothetical protein JWM11_3381 [Planctomycetaceae bacterium]|nr:hypothetical protein [Planctomycetaceae bacterium]